MDNFIIVIIRVSMLFLMMLPAYLLQKAKKLSEKATRDLGAILLYVTSPCWIVYSFIRPFDKEIVSTSALIFAISFVIHLVTYYLSLLLFKKVRKDRASVLRFMMSFSNAGFMGFPILQAMFGSIGVLYGAVFVIAENIFVWTAGVALYSGNLKSFSIKNIFFNPSSIATYFALIIFCFGLGTYIPKSITSTLGVLGVMTAPLSVFIIGIRLTEVEFKKVFHDIPMCITMALRLLIIPTLSIFALKLVPLPNLALAIPFIASTMPAATGVTVFAEKYGGDAIYASKGVVINTALSIVTIPLMILIFQYIN